jgi:hypothetical protein
MTTLGTIAEVWRFPVMPGTIRVGDVVERA